MKYLAFITALPLSIAAFGESCDIIRDDQMRLLQFHAEATRNFPSVARPDLKDMFGGTERPIAGKAAECISVGPLRFIHVPDTWLIYLLNTNRAFERWQGIASHGPSTWRRDVQRFLSDFSIPPSKVSASMYGELPLNQKDLPALENAQKGSLPATVQIRIPTEDELRKSERPELDAASKRLLNRSIVQAVMSYLATEQPAALVKRLDVGQPTGNSSSVIVKVVVETAPGTSQEIALEVLINPTMAPYVGPVYKTNK